MIKTLICMSAIINVAIAAAAHMKIPPTPKELAHKEGCYIKEIQDVIPYNSNVTIAGLCELRKCFEDHILFATCGAIREPGRPECFLTNQDYSRPYSDCCPQMFCDIGENLAAE